MAYLNYTKSSIILRWLAYYTCSSIILGCSGVPQDGINERTPLDMSEVDAIVSAFPIQDPTLTIIFDDSSYEDPSSSGTATLGTCIVQANIITIDERFWVDTTREAKEALMYHEMAHCLLGIGHHNKTLMDSFIGFGGVAYREHGIDELYNLPCSFGCDLDRIKENRSKFYEY